MFQGVQSATKARHAGKVEIKGRDEAATKDEGHDRHGKKNQIKRKNGREQQLVSELLAADSQKVWLHAGREDTVQQWHNWLFEMKKKDERRGWKRSTRNESVV